MPFDDKGNACHAPVTGSRLMRTYRRTVGSIQVLYAAFFGWAAFLCLRWTAEQMSFIAQNGFSFRGFIFKGTYIPALDTGNLVAGIINALLSLSCFIGGCGLVGLRSWARRWEIAYFILASVYSLVVIVTEARRGHDLGYFVLFYGYFVPFYTILVLPYLPFLFISQPPDKVPLVGKVTRSKLAVDDLGDI